MEHAPRQSARIARALRRAASGLACLAATGAASACDGKSADRSPDSPRARSATRDGNTSGCARQDGMEGTPATNPPAATTAYARLLGWSSDAGSMHEIEADCGKGRHANLRIQPRDCVDGFREGDVHAGGGQNARGHFVAKITNVDAQGRSCARFNAVSGGGGLAPGDSVFWWIGDDGSGGVADEFYRFDAGSSSWQRVATATHENPKPGDDSPGSTHPSIHYPRAAWGDDRHPHRGDGSETWIDCDAGCCTAGAITAIAQ